MAVTLCVLLTPVAGGATRLVEYEDRVLARLPAHGARLVSRVRAVDPDASPFEVHVIEFPTEAALEGYLADPARQALSGVRDAVRRGHGDRARRAGLSPPTTRALRDSDDFRPFERGTDRWPIERSSRVAVVASCRARRSGRRRSRGRGLAASAAPSVGAAPTWAPAAGAAIHPGVQTLTEGAQCTANFIFTDASTVYVGQAAHCSGTGGTTETDGCTSGSLPIGTPVTVSGASKPGTLVYNSWLTMQARGEADADTCAYNDLALIRLDPADVAKVNPSIPYWGGPVGLATTGTTARSDGVLLRQLVELPGGITQLSPKTGVSLGDAGGGWSHDVSTVSPGIPGDSGSAFLDGTGRALGILSTLQLAPIPGSNGVGDLPRELAYLHAHTAFTATLVPGTEPFHGAAAGRARLSARLRLRSHGSRRGGKRAGRGATGRRTGRACDVTFACRRLRHHDEPQLGTDHSRCAAEGEPLGDR